MKKNLKTFIIYYLPAFAAVLIIFSIVYFFFYRNFYSVILREQEHTLEINYQKTLGLLHHIENDILLLSQLPDLEEYLQNKSLNSKNRLARDFQVFLDNKPHYDQLRFINAKGYEIIRIGKKNNKNLQYKGDRYYIKEALRLKAGEIFVSRFDLNIENDKLEIPYKPMLRFATPIYSSQGILEGLMIINVLGQHIQEIYAFSPQNDILETQKFLLNTKGFFLYSPQREHEWGFMLEEREYFSFALLYPKEWKTIEKQSAGAINSKHGLFVFHTFHLEKLFDFEQLTFSQTHWKAVIFIPKKKLQAYLHQHLSLMLSVFILFELVMAVLVFILSKTSIAKRAALQKLKLAAYTDPLTGLLNRRAFFERTAYELSKIERTKQSLAFFMADIDHFKDINDNFGHDFGDDVLQYVSETIKTSLRKQDSLCRWGGEEFLAMLPQTDLEGANTLAEKIRTKFEDCPFKTDGSHCKITLSFGISRAEEKDENIDAMIKRADQALYKAKNAGRNRVESE